MPAKGQTIIQTLEQLAPKRYAIPDDKIGLQLGSLNKAVEHVLVTLDVTDDVVEEAIALGVDLIVAHHAIIYRPLQQLNFDTPAGKLYEKLIKNNIAVYIAHTNLDVAVGGVNDLLAEALGLNRLSILEEVYTDRFVKLAVFVPHSHADAVRQAVFAAGAGDIGEYSQCSFNIEGTGTFMPSEGTTPYSGTQHVLSQEQEVRIETIVPQSLQRKVVQAMIKAHPYEEVAYDIYPLELAGKPYGLGRVGYLPNRTERHTLRELVEQVKNAFDVQTVRVVGDLEREVNKVAVLGGSGSRYVRHALFAGADVFITGDIDFHTAHDALAAGLCIIDPGHHVEKMMKQPLADYLQRQLAEKKYKTKVSVSQVDTEPFQFV